MKSGKSLLNGDEAVCVQCWGIIVFNYQLLRFIEETRLNAIIFAASQICDYSWCTIRGNHDNDNTNWVVFPG